jgi:gluconolactonase
MEYATQNVFRYQPDSGTLQTLVDDLDKPNGLVLTDDGSTLYIADTEVYDPQGTLLGFIGLGEGPANLTWGGDDWQTMYVTAVTSVYRLRTKIPGQPVRFAPK